MSYLDVVPLISIVLGPSLLKALRQAAQMAVKQRQLFNEFSATFPPEVVREWERVISLWNVNPGSGPDPYEEPETSKFGSYGAVTAKTSGC